MMVVKKEVTIQQTLDILRKKLEAEMQDEGFEYDQEKDAIRITADWANHLNNAVRPG
ncbi:MAG: hypothetical protein NTZ48_07105 [Candidatus Omnitrophica bacterium]|nr:hypothetical protein [Candidatus Omnitrophota bacterium]